MSGQLSSDLSRRNSNKKTQSKCRNSVKWIIRGTVREYVFGCCLGDLERSWLLVLEISNVWHFVGQICTSHRGSHEEVMNVGVYPRKMSLVLEGAPLAELCSLTK